MPHTTFSPDPPSYIHKVLDSTVQKDRITPTWSKVSDTCYEAHTKKVHGYGRLVKNISVSHDCPEEFVRTDHLTRPKDFPPPVKEFASRRAGIEAAYVLPGGSSHRDQPLRGRQYSKIKIDNQYIIEPKSTGRAESRIDLSWDSGRRSARSRGGSSTASPGPPSQLTLSPVKPKLSSVPGGIRPGTGGHSSRRVFSGNRDLHSARVRTASPGTRMGLSGTGFASAPKSFSTSNKRSWWIHED